MSRWSRRSDEEKQKILEDRDKREMSRDKKNEIREEQQKKEYLRLLKEHYIPLRCPEHGWVGSHQYVRFTGKHPIANEKIQWIGGACLQCGRPDLQRPIHPSFLGLDEGMIVAQLLMLLQSEGRIIDRREKEETHVKEKGRQ